MNKYQDVPLEDRWHVQKGVPIALIVTLLIQFCAGLWGYATLWSEVKHQGEQIIAMQPAAHADNIQIAVLQSRVSGAEARLISIEVETKANGRVLNQIAGSLGIKSDK